MLYCDVLLAVVGPVQRMEPLNQLQVAVKNNIDVIYFTAAVPYNSLWAEDGQMGMSSV